MNISIQGNFMLAFLVYFYCPVIVDSPTVQRCFIQCDIQTIRLNYGILARKKSLCRIAARSRYI